MIFFRFNPSQSVQAPELQTIDTHILQQWLDQQSVVLVDVRELGEFPSGYIPGAILVPLSKFDSSKISPASQQKIVLYCRSGQRSVMADQKLLQDGVQEVAHLGNGIGAWVKAGYPIQV